MVAPMAKPMTMTSDGMTMMLDGLSVVIMGIAAIMKTAPPFTRT